VGHLSPEQLLDATTTEQDLRDLVLESYLDSTLADQRPYEPQDARSYLAWIARFLNGDEVSPFGLKTSDYTVFDLADLTPPEPPRLYRLFEGLVLGLVLGLGYGWAWSSVWMEGVLSGLQFLFGLVLGLVFGLVFGLGMALPTGGPFKRSAVSSRLTLASWPSTRQQLLDFLRRVGPGLVLGLSLGLIVALVYEMGFGLTATLFFGRSWTVVGLFSGLGVNLLPYALHEGLGLALVFGLGFGLLETRSVLITSRTPMEARSRSLIAALTWLVSGLVGGLGFGLVGVLSFGGQVFGLAAGLGFGLDLALRNGGWFILLQKVAHRRLSRDGSLPSRPYDFLEWGIDRQIFRRVGGGVRFRHNLIQQHLASTSD
jgi:hypothetical protein